LEEDIEVRSPVEAGRAQTLADFLSDHLGVLASGENRPGGARMSEATGRTFVAGLVRKRQQNKL
jgi:hypothetical protein